MALAREHSLEHKLDGMAEYIRNAEDRSSQKLLEFQPNGTAEAVSLTQPSPIDASDPRVRHGSVYDTVVSDGVAFHRRREGVYPDTPDAMRFQTDRELTDEDIQRFASLVGYAYRVEVRGEPLSDPVRDSPYSFVIGTDMTKSQSDDLGMALERFEEALPQLIAEGSPERKTDRAGEGTKGTRLIDGVGAGIRFETYYDDVVDTA